MSTQILNYFVSNDSAVMIDPRRSKHSGIRVRTYVSTEGANLLTLQVAVRCRASLSRRLAG